MISADQPTIFDKTKLATALSSREDGNTSAKWSSPAEAEQVVAKIADSIGVKPESIAVMAVADNQDAWDEIADVTSTDSVGLHDLTKRIAADALVTNVPGLGLLLSVGDCNAVVVHDPVHNVLSVVHLGWQSTTADLATKIVQHLQQKYQSSAADLRIYFSPAIKAESYIFKKPSQSDNPAWKDFLKPAPTGVGIDLPGYNRQRFIDAGVLPEHIEVSPVDTGTSDNYFSHYRSVRSDLVEGRFALLAALK